MNKHLLISSLFVSMLLMLTGCEKMVTDVDVPQSPAKLVITGFITPDMPYTSIAVLKSKPLYTTSNSYTDDFNIVDDAFVTISNGVDTAYLIFEARYQSYRISSEDFPIEKGKKYYLRVTATGGFFAEATCTVPDSVPPQLELVNIDSSGLYGSSGMHANVKFKDINQEGNFYCLKAGLISWPEGQTTPTLDDLGFMRGDSYVSDKNNEDNYFTYTTNEFSKYGNGPYRLYFTLALTDENYYYYHKALINFDDSNPFAEPTPIYSNVKGGLGIFAAYIQIGIPFDL